MPQQINTSCEYCYFKQMLKTHKGEVQVGCSLNRIDKFKQHGAQVTLEKSTHDNNKYFLIHDRFCTTLRQKAWAEKQTNPAKVVRKAVELQCDVIILVNDPNTTYEDVKITVKSAVKQEVLPRSIRIVTNTDFVQPLLVYDMLNTEVPDNIDVYVHSVKLVDKDGNRLSKSKSIDIAADKCESQYYAVFEAGFDIPTNFLKDIDIAINDDLKRVCMVTPDVNGNGLVVQNELHKRLLGNKELVIEADAKSALVGDNLVDKVKYVAEQTKMRNVIFSVEDICQNFQHSQ